MWVDRMPADWCVQTKKDYGQNVFGPHAYGLNVWGLDACGLGTCRQKRLQTKCHKLK